MKSYRWRPMPLPRKTVPGSMIQDPDWGELLNIQKHQPVLHIHLEYNLVQLKNLCFKIRLFAWFNRLFTYANVVRLYPSTTITLIKHCQTIGFRHIQGSTSTILIFTEYWIWFAHYQLLRWSNWTSYIPHSYEFYPPDLFLVALCWIKVNESILFTVLTM